MRLIHSTGTFPVHTGAGLATPLVLEGPAGGAAGGVGRFLYEDYPAHVELLQQERQAVLREGCYRHPELRRFRSTRGLFHIIAGEHGVWFKRLVSRGSGIWAAGSLQTTSMHPQTFKMRDCFDGNSKEQT